MTRSFRLQDEDPVVSKTSALLDSKRPGTRWGVAALIACSLVAIIIFVSAPSSRQQNVSGRSADRSAPVFGICAAQPSAVQLRWGANPSTADHICCKQHDYAEYWGYWESTSFPMSSTEPITFYDPTTGRPLFIAPRGRSYADFIRESRHHGWPSFRDAELVKENVLVLPGGETISVMAPTLATTCLMHRETVIA
eukprot:CAMPEP_0174729066 /NCGR_PEP_ID=MMETSP1094-20130205/52956_1 /TAXON_ID=156173 /ORGANISM="Chrysochromulina brevifilum, Strain UTEX LB 985" /LENGTH=194 /DNA_ID=CAMNT_0015931105 /DNA_START=27 /DNA_END=612 /DNA_ORIENTATION=-